MVEAELLQALEAMIEQVRRLSDLAAVLVTTMQNGQRLSDAALANHSDQLKAVQAQQDQMELRVRGVQATGRADEGELTYSAQPVPQDHTDHSGSPGTRVRVIAFRQHHVQTNDQQHE